MAESAPDQTLLEAVRNGDIEQVKLFLNYDDDAEMRQSALMAAVERGDKCITRLLVDAGVAPDRAFLIGIENFFKAFEELTHTGDCTDILDILLDSGVWSTYNWRDRSAGQSALIAAVVASRVDKIKDIIHADSGVSVNLGVFVNDKFMLPLAVACIRKDAPVISCLLGYGAADPSDQMEYVLIKDLGIFKLTTRIDVPLDLAKQSRSLMIHRQRFVWGWIAAFIVGGPNKRQILEKLRFADDKCLIFEAILMQCPLAIKLLLPNVEDINSAININGYRLGTPLQIAIKHGVSNEIFDLLIKSGADVNLISGNNTPLTLAVHCYSWKAVAYFLGKGANPNIFDGRFTNIILSGMIAEEYIEHVTALLPHIGNINKNLIGLSLENLGTPLEIAIKTNKKTDMCDLLIENGADVNLTSEGRFPLLLAVQSANPIMASYILKKGADPNSAHEKYGYTPLHCIFRWRHSYHLGERLRCIQDLLTYGAIAACRRFDGATPLDLVLLEIKPTLWTTRMRRLRFPGASSYRTDVVLFLELVEWALLLLRNGDKPSKTNLLVNGVIGIMRRLGRRSRTLPVTNNILELVKTAIITGSITLKGIQKIYSRSEELGLAGIFKDIREYLRDYLDNFNLNELCRLVVRRAIRPPTVENITQLPLPVSVRNFILTGNTFLAEENEEEKSEEEKEVRVHQIFRAAYDVTL